MAQSESAIAPNAAVIDWIEPRELPGYSLVCVLFLVCGSILMFFMLIGLDRYEAGDTAIWYIFGGPVVFFAIAILIALMGVAPAYSRRRRLRQAQRRTSNRNRSGSPSVEDARTLLAGAICRAGISASRRLSGRACLPQITACMGELDSKLPRNILDRRIAKQVLAIERTPHLLEPESIDSRGTRLLEYLTWLWLPGLIALYWLFGERSPLLLGFIAIGVIALVLRIKHWIQTGVMPGESGLVAGVGYLEGPQGGRLASEKVVTIICKARLQAMRVRLLAPDWNFELKFPSPRDPGFIAFWQRWNHPHPRPELLDH